jgi:glycosyltransferase involved in cell wall biosynthesis
MVDLRISVVIPTYNRANYLLQALGSVFVQTAPPSEVIVIDDGSTDDTQAKLDTLIKEKKITYVFQLHSGVSRARNAGIELANFPLVAFLDSDDLFMPTKLEKQLKVISDHPDLGFVHCNFLKFGDQGEDLGIRDTSRFSGKIYPGILQEWSVLMAMPCMLARADVLKEVGGFDEKMTWAEDMDLWRRIARRYTVDTVPEVLVKVRVHEMSTTHVRSGGSTGFGRYLEKAFAEDLGLGWTFKATARAKMYAKFGQNLLGDGDWRQMQLVRNYQLKAIRSWPLSLGAIVTWLASFLPQSFRKAMVEVVRRRRYPLNKIETL